ncbi:MAG: ribosome biogenesis GTPase YqeH [Solobacterium sp.]|nr:ribosome biogenesis GTPase YqeH [Solobacterium sp.]
MTICKGCGAILQHEDKNKAGYTPKADGEYCQRCFRLIHYDDPVLTLDTGIDQDQVLQRIAAMDCMVLWVADLFDFEAGIISGLNRLVGEKEIVLCANKRDILPQTLNHEKIARFVFARLKEAGIRISGLVLTSREDPECIDEVLNACRLACQGKPIAVMGRANSGKSTLINHLMRRKVLTESRYPGTTLDFNTIEIEGMTFVDTPGIEVNGSLLTQIDEKDYKDVIPSGRIKPQIYQLRGDQSFAIGGLARIDIEGCDQATCVFYVSGRLSIHRSKVSGADALWQKHRGELLQPIAKTAETDVFSDRKEYEKMDVVIDGLGWACLSGQIRNVRVKVPHGVSVTFRKAMV